MNTQQRLKEYLEFKKDKITNVEKKIGASQDALGKAIRDNKSFGIDKLEELSKIYPKLNLNWLITGKGEMEIIPFSGKQPEEKNTEFESLQDEHIKLQEEFIALQDSHYGLYEKYTAVLEKYANCLERVRS